MISLAVTALDGCASERIAVPPMMVATELVRKFRRPPKESDTVDLGSLPIDRENAATSELRRRKRTIATSDLAMVDEEVRRGESEPSEQCFSCSVLAWLCQCQCPLRIWCRRLPGCDVSCVVIGIPSLLIPRIPPHALISLFPDPNLEVSHYLLNLRAIPFDPFRFIICLFFCIIAFAYTN